jgi:hypothetical protein
MNDFEVQRRLRQLNAPLEPRNDLWAGIAQRIGSEAAAPRHSARWLPLAAAAGLLVAVSAATLLLGLRPSIGFRPTADTHAVGPDARLSPHAMRVGARTPGGDPRLLGAAVVLDAAHAELEQALEQRPDAVFLVSLLNRTNMQRLKLDHVGANAG